MDLTQLAKKYKTDKYEDRDGGHKYTHIYEKELHHLKDEKFTLLELGIGGYTYPDRGGSSLRMWVEWFTKADIHGIDLYDKNFVVPRATIHKGSQIDDVFLRNLVEKIGKPKVIIDDASHINHFTIRTFEILFPLLEKGGIYIIEDVHTSYWKDNYGGNPDYKDYTSETTLNYIKKKVDYLNWFHLGLKEPEFTSISFFSEMIIIKK